MRLKRFSICELILIVTLLFPISTLIEKIVPLSNKMVLVLFFLNLMLYIVEIGFKRKTIVFLCIFAISYLISCVFSTLDAILVNINMAFYLPMTILFYLYFIERKDKIKDLLYKDKNIIFFIILVYSSILIVSIFLPMGYMTIDGNLWEGGRYFAAFSKSPNRVGPASLFINCLIIYLASIKYRHKILPIFSLLQMYPAFMSGSRTYLVLISVTEIIFLYVWLGNKKSFFLFLIPLIVCFFGVLVNSSSGMKIINSLSQKIDFKDSYFWKHITNSRNVIWAERLGAFSSFALINKIFGSGINYTSYKFGLWSHNDFIEILSSFGFWGVLNYLYCIHLTINTLLRKNTYKLLKLLVVFVWLFNAFFNFFYVYTNAMLSYPFLLLAVDIFTENHCKVTSKIQSKYIEEATKK